MTEDELIARCRGGDEDAFRHLVETYHERVYRTAYALTANPDDASEVVQETFLKAWRGIGQFRGEATLGTWLTRLALNAGSDYLRRQRRGVVQRLRELVPWHQADHLRVAEDRDELDRALRQLTASARQVIALRYGLDLPIAEIARIIGCPEGTAKSRLNAATTRLRAIIAQERARSGKVSASQEVPRGES